jgi:hypothetical protein
MQSLAAVSDFDLSHQSVLGVLEFHDIPDIKIAEDELMDMWQRHGLDATFVPRIRPVDAFRRATSAVERKIMIEQDGLHYEARIEVDDVTKDSACIVRLLNRKLIDKINQATPLLTVGKFEFDRTTNMMRIFGTALLDDEYNYTSILQEASTLFREFKDFHNRVTLRNVVNRLVRSTNPVSMQDHSQGKFIPRDYIPTMINLKNLLAELKEQAAGEGCSVSLLPLVDCQDLRDVLSQRLNAEVMDEAGKILNEAKEAKGKGKLRLEKAQSLTERFVGLREKVEQYETLIKGTMPDLTRHILWAMNNIEDDVDVDIEPIILTGAST